ncbi:MAG: DNA translocase FtsK 4TM domain-containing protein, partial [Deltaproteobacteria bacterium]|nr:DNA translocase FtsK 4TM domain-containing protein [Deltaproteobacteria bacterium]
MPKERSKPLKKRGLSEEITGIVFLALALLFGASLVVYHTGSENWIGLLGNNISWVLFASIGYTAYIFPIIFLILAIELLVRSGVSFRPSIPISIVLFIASASAVLALGVGGDGQQVLAGGALGSLVAGALRPYVGVVGGVIIFGAVFLISLRVGTGISLINLTEKVFQGVSFIFVKSFGASSRAARWSTGKLGEFKARKEAGAEEKSAETKEKKPVRKKVEPTIVTPKPPTIKEKRLEAVKDKEALQEEFEFVASATGAKGAFQLPNINFLERKSSSQDGDDIDKATILTNTKILEKKLKDFGVDGAVLEVHPGPVVTTYEFEPAPGIKVGKITNLSDDLALAMRASSIRILAPIPGKAVVGIEIPNAKKASILFREILESSEYAKTKSKLALALGKDITGMPFVADLAKMPHVLVAGATGAGKSVSINAMILSILYKATPEEVRFLMIDPKMLELTPYAGIPHLIAPVVTDAKRANIMLKSIVTEMEKRYKLMSEIGAKNIEGYNALVAEDPTHEDTDHRKFPYIVV